MSAWSRHRAAGLRIRYANRFGLPLEQIRVVEFVGPEDVEDAAVGSAHGPIWTVWAEAPEHVKRAVREGP